MITIGDLIKNRHRVLSEGPTAPSGLTLEQEASKANVNLTDMVARHGDGTLEALEQLTVEDLQILKQAAVSPQDFLTTRRREEALAAATK